MAISINQTQPAESVAGQTAQIESGSYTQQEKGVVGKTPVHMQVSEIHRAKRKKNYYAWILELLTRETSSDLRKKVFGSDPLR